MHGVVLETSKTLCCAFKVLSAAKAPTQALCLTSPARPVSSAARVRHPQQSSPPRAQLDTCVLPGPPPPDSFASIVRAAFTAQQDPIILTRAPLWPTQSPDCSECASKSTLPVMSPVALTTSQSNFPTAHR